MPSIVSVFGVEPARIGGNECFARELSAQLGERGWQSVLCFLSEPPGEVRRFLELPNVSLEVISESYALNGRALKDFFRVMRRHRPQILHLHFTGFLGLYPTVGRLMSVEQTFFTDQASHPEGYVASRVPAWKRAIARAVNRPVSRVICVSDYNRRCLATLDLLPADRSEVIYNSVDLSRVSVDERAATDFHRKHSIPAGRAIVAQVSWIIPEKGIADLLAAARLVISRNPDVHFVFVGEGAYRSQYTNLAEQMGISNYVTWTGLVRDPLAEGVYSSVDVVCQVSRWEEAFGWVIAEAMAYGKPVVATRVGGIPELIEDGKSGFLIERGDTVNLADRILALLNDRRMREQMGHVARHTVESRFNLKENVARLLDLYGLSPAGQSVKDYSKSMAARSPRASAS